MQSSLQRLYNGKKKERFAFLESFVAFDLKIGG